MTVWRVPRPIAAASVLIGVTAAVGSLLYGLRTEATAVVDQLPDAAKRLRRMVESDRPTTAAAIQQVQRAATELERAANAAARPRRPPAFSACRWRRRPSTSAAI